MTAPVPVVVDTNVFVAAAFNPGSASGRIVDALRGGELELCWNAATRDETRRILSKIPRISWDPFASLYGGSGEYAGTLDLGEYGFVSGSLDREFLALAEAADAPLISNDDDLLAPRGRARTPILTPAEFVDWWQSQ